MPFDVAEIETKENRPPQATLSYMRSKARGKSAKPLSEAQRDKLARGKPQLHVTLPTTVFISKKEHFVLMFGTGQDAGRLRIKGQNAKNKVSVVVRDRKHSAMFCFGYVPKLGDDIFDGERCALRRISDDEYEIDAHACLGMPLPSLTAARAA